jgi:hypothetical protein
VLQKNETLRFGEYRTERLVLAAFGRLTGAGAISASSAPLR